MAYYIKRKENNAYFAKNLGLNWNHWTPIREAKKYSTELQAKKIIKQYKLKNVVIENVGKTRTDI